MRNTLVYAARADNVDVATYVLLYVVLCQTSTDFYQESLPIPCASSPLLFQLCSRNLDPIWCEVVQHDDVSASGNRFVCFFEALAFDFNLGSKAAC